MKFFHAFILILVSASVVIAHDDDDDHSNHCHISGYPTIHVNIGEHFDLPGACIRLLCKTTDLFEAVNICESVPNSPQNVAFATSLLKSEKCPK